MLKLLGTDARKNLKETTAVSALGIEMGLAIVVGYFAGRWLDGRFDTGPYLSYLGFAFGIGAAAKAIIRTVRQYQKANPDRDLTAPPEAPSNDA